MPIRSGTILLVTLGVLFAGCDDKRGARPAVGQTTQSDAQRQAPPESPEASEPTHKIPERDFDLVHVFVALADNKHQGIVPVPEILGNGRDAANNLYWGAMYGVKTFFGRSKNWRKLEIQPHTEHAYILDNAAFQYKGTVVIAQAYDGSRMKAALHDFFAAVAGKGSRRFNITGINNSDASVIVESAGMANVNCFVGHNGLMDMRLDNIPSRSQRSSQSFAVVLACKSNPYFAPFLKQLDCIPLITTSGLMAPEAYTLDAILVACTDDFNFDSIHAAAARAYAKYQKCSVSAARRLFVPYSQD
ncbi:MAG: hypothetical protein ACYS8Z_15090 [Planctomycetota bacterium]